MERGFHDSGRARASKVHSRNCRGQCNLQRDWQWMIQMWLEGNLLGPTIVTAIEF